MQADCAAAAEAMAARQAEASLYDRLGGRDAIHAVTADIVARHHQNEAIAHLFETTDDAALADPVTDFLSQAFGGDVEYTGRDMVSTHEGMGLTDDYFLAAGADVQAALEAAGVGADEIQVQTPSRFPTHDLSPNATAFPPQAQAGSNPT